MLAGGVQVSVGQLYSRRHPSDKSGFYVGYCTALHSNLQLLLLFFLCNSNGSDITLNICDGGNSVNENRSLSNSELVGSVPASITELDQLEQM